MTALPAWLRPGTSPLAPHRPGRSHLRRGAEALAARLGALARPAPPPSGFLAALDPRAKVIGGLCLIVAATLTGQPLVLALGYTGCLLLAAWSRLPLRRFLALWLAVPLFSAVVMLPATLDVVTPGHPLLVLWHDAAWRIGAWRLPSALTVTDAGLLAAGRMVLRTALCASLAWLVAASTPPVRLFYGLRVLGVPSAFVMTLALMHRYLAVLVQAAHDLHLARLSRTVGPSPGGALAFVAAGVGSLFRRTHSLGRSVCLAMLSRGYRGEVRLLDAPRWQAQDWLASLTCCLALAAAWWWR